jgi:integrative and conjugative element protein (TIGR02256 family)
MSKSRAWINRAVLEALTAEAERRYPNETGGLLIGYTSEMDVIITACTMPGPCARHNSTLYIPDAEHDQEQLDIQYKQSGRQYTYLGDWHTHPDAAPYLSRTDIRTLTRIARTPEARQTRPLMSIIGGRPGAWVPAVWQHNRERPTVLKIVVYTELPSR